MEKTINDIKINVPEGMEAYLEGNIIKFKPIKKKLTYEDIAKELFDNEDVWRIENFDIIKYNKTGYWNFLTNCVSEKQAQKLLAIKKLMNVAKYLNGDWLPNWDNNQENKYTPILANNNREIIIAEYQTINRCFVYFKTYELAKQAIEILGEETIKLTICTDW